MGVDFHTQLVYVEPSTGNDIPVEVFVFKDGGYQSQGVNYEFRNSTVYEIIGGEITPECFDYQKAVDIAKVASLCHNHTELATKYAEADKANKQRQYLFGHNVITLYELEQLLECYQQGLTKFNQLEWTLDQSDDDILTYKDKQYTLSELVETITNRINNEYNDLNQEQFKMEFAREMLYNVVSVESREEAMQWHTELKEELEGIVWCLKHLIRRIDSIYSIWYKGYVDAWGDIDTLDQNLASRLHIVFSFDC